MSIEQNGEVIHKTVTNDAPVQFNDVTIFSIDNIEKGDQFIEYDPANATIKNFYIWNYSPCSCTVADTTTAATAGSTTTHSTSTAAPTTTGTTGLKEPLLK